MCRITLTYDPNNPLARRKLASLLNSGLFKKEDIRKEKHTPSKNDTEEETEKRQFIGGAKILSSKIFAKKL